MIVDPERLRRLRRLRDRTRDHPKLHKEVCARIVAIECGPDRLSDPLNPAEGQPEPSPRGAYERPK